MRRNPVEYPDDLRYTKEHEWARVEGDVVRVGITDFAQDALGDVVYVDLPESGTEVHAGQAFARGRVDQVRLRRVQPRSTGSIVERNPLARRASGAGERAAVRRRLVGASTPADLAAVEGFLDAAAYRAFVEDGSR